MRNWNLIRKEILNYQEKKTNDTKKEISLLILGGSQAAAIFAEKLPYIFAECINAKILLKNLSTVFT